LRQNFPNPFNPTTIIQYALPRTSQVQIEVYNVLGQRVRTLVNEIQTPGYKVVNWDGKDDTGSEVSSGVYFCRIQAGSFVKSRKMTLLK
jgi:flagellar hook assembly protein FlgD